MKHYLKILTPQTCDVQRHENPIMIIIMYIKKLKRITELKTNYLIKINHHRHRHLTRNVLRSVFDFVSTRFSYFYFCYSIFLPALSLRRRYHHRRSLLWNKNDL